MVRDAADRSRLQPRPTVEATTRAGQPYEYRRRELVEPDWTRFPGWRDVTREQWESAQWQRVNCVKNIKQLRAVLGDLVDERFYADLDDRPGQRWPPCRCWSRRR